MDTTEQLKFIVNFADANLNNLRHGDWMNLQEDFARFFPEMTTLSPGAVIFDPRQDPEHRKYPQTKFKPLQDEVKALLQAKTKAKGTAITTPIDIKVSYMYVAGDGIIVIGKVRDLFLQRVINVLVSEETSRIRQCICGRFFLRVRRQVHCSPQCADVANYRERLEKAKAKKKQKRRKK